MALQASALPRFLRNLADAWKTMNDLECWNATCSGKAVPAKRRPM
jgi:hypothetical protein